MRFVLVFCLLIAPTLVSAQADPLRMATVTRPPFSMVEGDKDTGFAIELFEMIAADLERPVEFQRVQLFGEMLQLVETGRVDGAISNISMTAEREERIDFSQPIYESGLQILLPGEAPSMSIFSAVLTWDIAAAVLISIGLLFGGGMLMWVFERNRQPYFDRSLKEAGFPAFWWALNLIVNGGFEERMPQSRPGRIFAVMLVVASLFVVSVFVAKVTSALTVSALQNTVSSLADLEGRRVGTIGGSTASVFLNNREIRADNYSDLETLIEAFETGGLDAVFFDAPILNYYAATRGRGSTRLLDRIYRPESYGIALQPDSPLREDINRSLLRLREDGRYAELYMKWFNR